MIRKQAFLPVLFFFLGSLPAFSVALPNLHFYQPSGYTAYLVLSKTDGSHIDLFNFITSDKIEVNCAVFNDSSVNITAPVVVEFDVDGSYSASATFPSGIPAGYYGTVTRGWATFAAGKHTMKAIIDPANTITESNETDNTFSRTFSVNSTTNICQVYGKVTNLATGAPIIGADVAVTTTGVVHDTTDDAGMYCNFFLPVGASAAFNVTSGNLSQTRIVALPAGMTEQNFALQTQTSKISVSPNSLSFQYTKPGIARALPATQNGSDILTVAPASPPNARQQSAQALATLKDSSSFLAPSAVAQIQATQVEKQTWTASQRKMDSHLLMSLKAKLNLAKTAGLPVESPIACDAQDRYDVDITCTVSKDLVAQIVALGGEVVYSSAANDSIRAKIPAANLDTLARNSAVRFIKPFLPPVTNQYNTSAGVAAHQANLAQSTFGAGGAGVKVGVLSDSAHAWQVASLIASGDLPPDASVLSGQDGPASGEDEGAAMMEIVHDMAPNATPIFATADISEASFADNITALKDAGCKVITDDVFYFDEPVFEDGVVAKAVNGAVAAGTVCFTSAGNGGNLTDGTSGTWEGDYVAKNTRVDLGGVTASFGAGDLNLITHSSPYGYSLQWSDPYSASTNDYDLYLISSNGSTVLGSSTTVQNGLTAPIEWINANSNAGEYLLILKKTAAAPRFLHLSTNRGGLSVATTGETSGHSAAANEISMAATDATLALGTGGVFTTGQKVETFSSDGPRRIFYKPDGTAYTPGNFSSTGGLLLQKPDFTAADGVSCAASFFDPFYGTSAASPHGAGIAALMFGLDPALHVSDIRLQMKNKAIDIEGAGVDNISGSGILNAYQSCNAVPRVIASQSFTIFNDGPGFLNLDQLKLKTAAPWITWWPFPSGPIGPGQSLPITVFVNYSLAKTGTISKRLNLFSNDTADSPYPSGVDISTWWPGNTAVGESWTKY